MPKPVRRVSDVRPKQAVFAASIKQHPQRLVLLTEGDSWFSYPLNYPVDAVLMSAGGNDLVSRELSRILDRKTNGASWQSTVKLAPLTTVLDMRAALPADNVHWADEIHPSGTGFRRLAENHWRPILKAQFPGRGFD